MVINKQLYTKHIAHAHSIPRMKITTDQPSILAQKSTASSDSQTPSIHSSIKGPPLEKAPIRRSTEVGSAGSEREEE